MAELKGNKYGTHRVIEPKGVLTQAAWKIDNDMSKVYSNEIVCDVTSLNIDSASFTQISEACGGDEKKIGEMILGHRRRARQAAEPRHRFRRYVQGRRRSHRRGPEEQARLRPEGGRQDRLPGVPVHDPAEDRQDPGHPQGYRPRGHRRQGHPVRVRPVLQDAR